MKPDDQSMGQSNEVTTPEIVKKNPQSIMVLDDRQLKAPELTDIAEISKSAVHRILSENLDARKLCARWVPCLCSRSSKNSVVQIFQLSVWRSFSATK
ncbi:hypothetical protein TNCV_4077841 [Trichonephila clavipes]|nr:hypothetical protein TNCV_4077841 [Trichonephila clavipes]